MIPPGAHNDWPWPFSYIPRSWFAWNSDKPPKKLLGNALEDTYDITDPGTWALVWPLYFTFRTESGWHFRTGFRYDYSNHYYTFVPITIKRIQP